MVDFARDEEEPIKGPVRVIVDGVDIGETLKGPVIVSAPKHGAILTETIYSMKAKDSEGREI